MLRLDLPDTDNLAAAAGALSPRIWDDLVAFNGAARTHARLSGREFEAARYRIALINDCNLCQSRRGAPGEEEGDAGIPESSTRQSQPGVRISLRSANGSRSQSNSLNDSLSTTSRSMTMRCSGTGCMRASPIPNSSTWVW